LARGYEIEKEYHQRKNKIIIEAIDLLDEAGIQGLTTKEIAKRQGITEPAHL
jgi:AcrR family transcriptional regulator